MNIRNNLFICSALYSTCIVGFFIRDTAAKSASCPGQTRFYNDLRCISMYPGYTRCPHRYLCKSIESRDPNKCYIHGTEYEIGTHLPFERFRRPEELCRCEKADPDSNAAFVCTFVNCSHVPPPKPGCYRQRKATEPCPGPEICPKNPLDRPTCEVDGKVYLDGEYFVPASSRYTQCYCGPGYTGQNVAPYCIFLRSDLCRTELFYGDAIARGCVPIFEMDQSPITDCPTSFKCPKKTDQIGKNIASKVQKNVPCKFGNLTMVYGDILRSDFDLNCVRCICVVGPVPMCRRLPDSKCKRPTSKQLS